MNRKSGLKRNKGEGFASGAFICERHDMDDIQLARSMRGLAVELRVQERAVMKADRNVSGRIHKAIKEAAALERRMEDGGAALKRLMQDARLMESCAEQAEMEGGTRLPACGRKPRILSVMERLSGNGTAEMNRERMMRGIAAFDDVQALTMQELWAAPAALRIVIAARMADAAQNVVNIARQRLRAEAWAREGGSCPGISAVFFERALQIAGEQELPELRGKIEDKLARMGESPERMIRAAHETEAALLLGMDRLMSCRRLLDGLDWQECFEQLSAVDRELRYDPTHIYPGMDDASRDVVRGEVSVIAQKLQLSEITIARHAVTAAIDAARAGDERRGTVCWWLTDDEGRKRLAKRMGAADRALPKRVPDPKGRMCVRVITAMAAAFFGLWLLWIDSPWLILPGIPLAWTAANRVIGRVYPRLFKPMRLLSMEVGRVPDEWRTLVVMPALLGSAERAEEMCRRMEAAGCLEKDRNIRYLLLGDFSDEPQKNKAGDANIVQAARSAVKKMNERAGWEKYGYVHRPRTWLKVDKRWMGLDRKRGALMALNRVLMGIPGAEDAFSAEGSACAWLKEGFTFVVTLDADTRFLPGDVRRLIGVMAHPMNRRTEDGGYGILQPNMEMLPAACTNEFVRLFAGSGGLNTYPVSVSSLWQDLTGEGMFQGKGIYDVRAFYDALEGVLPEGRILSHDLIEGAIVGAGFAGDISFYDGYPAKLSSVMKRLNRWTRGDWQLLPFVFSGKPLRGGRMLTLPQRLRMADNLMRSLYAPALLAVFIIAVLLGSSNALGAGMLMAYLNPILYLFADDRLKWRRATAELAILPVTAWYTMDAIIRTLWRLAVSGKHMLDWVTAEDAEHARENIAFPGCLAAALLLPGLFFGGWAGAAVALMALFLIAPGWIRDLERETAGAGETLNGEQVAVLNSLARDTWRFFEMSVPVNGNGLPPDNVQIDPPAGAAKRTSPTNIGLYLLSCLSAYRMGFIREDETAARMAEVMDSMDAMEKWNGHLFNWYDTETLEVLRPRYVSSVDSGNLAACLLLTASAVGKMKDVDAKLGRRMRAMAENMKLDALYDDRRQLFRIGYDADSNMPSASHYDLLASESRILSYTAIMLGQVDIRHWSKLSRTAVNTGTGCAPVSWSGTMFEYLMPELFMRAPAHSLIGAGNRAVVRAQKQLGAVKNRPWGVSESGYYAFDMHLNYQYRAFGLKSLAMGGGSENVVAPYACLLALPFDAAGAAENVRRMQKLGWTGEQGLFEAADYLRVKPDGRPNIVKSHMAHHQGMILCALCNALGGNYLVNSFMDIPEARAIDLLLQEKPVTGVRLKAAENTAHAEPANVHAGSAARMTRPETYIADTHIICGGDATAVITHDGAVHYMKKGICATRFHGDLIDRKDGACLHVYDRDSGTDRVPGREDRMRLDAGSAEMTVNADGVDVNVKICISPEDGTLYRDIRLENRRETPARLTVADVMPAALCPEAEFRAHSVFANLFVESSPLGQKGVLLTRRPRDRRREGMRLVHMTSEPDARFETDYEKLTGRTGDTLRPGGVRLPFGNRFGTILNPVSAISADVELAPGEVRHMHFAVNLIESGDDAELWMKEVMPDTAPERALQLAAVRSRAMLDFIGVDRRMHRLLQRGAALLMDGRLSSRLRDDHVPTNGMARNRLWETGISGDLPIILMYVNDAGQAENVHRLIMCHEFYRAMGILTDLVLVNDFAGGYDQPVRDMIAERVASSHLRHMQSVPGGVWVPDGRHMSESARRVLERASAMSFTGGRDVFERLRVLLAGLERRKEKPFSRMDVGEDRMMPEALVLGNTYGGFLPDGGYAIDVLPERHTPAPWANILSNDRGGMLLTERGGGFFWGGNSRSDRITPFGNDVLREGWGMMLYLIDRNSGTFVRLLPGIRPDMRFRVIHDGSRTRYLFDTDKLRGCVSFCMAEEKAEAEIRVEIENREETERAYTVLAFIDWQMGVDAKDAGWLVTWNDGGACYASGTAAGVGYFAVNDPAARTGPGRLGFLGRGGMEHPEGLNEMPDSGGWTLEVPVALVPNRPRRMDFALGCAEDVQDAREQVRRFYGRQTDEQESAAERWKDMKNRLVIETPDPAGNHMANGFLIHQALDSRVRGRTGLYQPGGAYGFRDQLQDMLAIMHFDPERVRAHILRCAAHQFEDGDVMHWWHEPALGVRTKISDDLLFLPFVTAAYVNHTGDRAILEERIRYLENADIPEGQEDVFAEMRPGQLSETLHRHCMRAFERASRTGSHGLALMGSGDWNDGMNRVGDQGRGESVWLSEFIIACANAYGDILDEGADRQYLKDLATRMTAAVETQGWDGSWYLRAYTDDGEKLGSAENDVCRIDAISQAWAVLAGLNPGRCSLALDSAWEMLADQSAGIVKLLTPPFDGDAVDPGYIRGYPAGVRENGAQYTHGACWLLLAMIRSGRTREAKAMLGMLLPTGHSDSKEAADRYRVEPYVMAADVCSVPPNIGRGGWTWYTGAASWMYNCILAILGYERRGSAVRLDMMPGFWDEAAVTVPFGAASYRLVCRTDCDGITLDGKLVEGPFITMTDDGMPHTAIFPVGRRRAVPDDNCCRDLLTNPLRL